MSATVFAITFSLLATVFSIELSIVITSACSELQEAKMIIDKKIVDAIEAINDNSYKVESFEISPLEGNTKSSNDNQTTGKTVESASITPTFELPNVLDLFQVII